MVEERRKRRGGDAVETDKEGIERWNVSGITHCDKEYLSVKGKC